MADHVEVKARGKSHIGLEGERFLLLAPSAQNPLHWKRTGQKTNGEAGIVEPARGKMECCLQPRTAGLPAQIGDAAFSETCGLHPLEHVPGPAPVVADKPGIPEETKGERYANIDQKETGHEPGCLCREILRLIDATTQGEETEKRLWKT